MDNPATRKQRQTALVKANESRFQGSQIKKDLKRLPYTQAWRAAAELLRDCPPTVQHMRLLDFLEAVPGVGQERIRRICQKHPTVWPLRRIGTLTVTERERLAERVLTHGGWGSPQRDVPGRGLDYAA
jgi:hypothetical protein